MSFYNGIGPENMLGKRPRDDSCNQTLAPPAKKRKEDLVSASYPTPESTQSSSANSSTEESERSSAKAIHLRRPNPPQSQSGATYQPKVDTAHATRTKFIGDLSNYTALGTLTIRLSKHGAECIHNTEWAEISHASSWDLWSASCDWLSDGEPAFSAIKLSKNGLARIFGRKHQKNGDFATIRVYVLPDDVGRRYFDRRAWKGTSNLRSHLEYLIHGLDISSESWEGHNCIADEMKHYGIGAKEDDSLFYLFNTLPSPKTGDAPVACPVSSDAIQSVLASDQQPGLKTTLYPYQKRTVAKMIRREVEPERALDPRFQPLKGPTGQIFFYDNVTAILLRDRREYEEVRGGILGESMGLGKTLICLATILATHGNWPEIPPEYSINRHPVREKVGSLMQMAAAAVCRNRVPWRALFQDALRAGQDHRNPFDMLEANAGSYVIPPPEVKYSRRSSRIPEGRTIRLSTGTLIIIPQNLLSQWRTEISNHVEIGRLQILYLESGNETLMPPVNTLLKYDIILMSRPRFEKEMVPSESIKASSRTRKARGGCMCSLDEDCNCSKGDDYRSPLMDIHWLRIVMDEGHEFSSSGRAGTAYWALQNLRVDRKWIVSGTPASGLMGVEVGAAIQETSKSVPDDDHTSNRQYLEAWRKESVLMQERKDLEKLGVLVSGFLQVKPWANSKEEDPASWQKYIMPYQDGRRKAGSLKRLLESLVVRHRIEDIEADIQLPPLYNRVAYLQPSGHDKLSMNLFILSLAANAVTSERVDEDYMFHSKNRRQLNILISSLRQGGFYWTSIPPEAISQTMKVSRAYLERHEGKSSSCSDADRILLEKAIEIGELALGSDSWRSFADLHEMGIYVAGFPEQAQSAWSLVPMQTRDLLLTGITQLAEAQRWVDSHLYASDPASGLAELGVSTMQKLWQAAQRDSGTSISEETVLGNDQINHSPHSKGYSSLAGLPRLTRERTVSRAKVALIPQNSKNAALARQPPTLSGTDKPTGLKSALKSALRTPVTANPVELLPSDSPLAKSKLCGTASAKLTYLLDRVTVLHQTEKILIFYEGDQIAWYIAQALDLIDIRYLIYTKTLSLARQAAYITTFNGTETFRVLLMNVHQAAHGLHIASASRVFFVNPVWQPNVEAQAIKRAHRIGQTRPVYVETLVLKDTLEDQMLQRRKGMTPQEHQKAERSLLDDDTMSTIIKRAHFIPLLDEEIHDVSKQMAKLETCHQLFARSGKGGGGDVDDPDADLIFPEDMPVSEKQKQKKTRKISRKIVAQAASLPSIIPPVQNLGRADGLPSPSLSNTDREEAGASGPSIEKHKIDFEHRPDLENSAPLKSIAVGRAVSGGSVGSSKHSVASLVPSSQSLPQDSATSSNSAGRSKKRVGFALDAARLSEDEPPSLFGDGSPATSSIRQRGSDDGHAPQAQFAATATGLLVEESARDVESGGSASRKGVKFFVTDT